MSKSPRPEEVTKVHVVMDFPDAMREVMNGKRVTKLEWNNPDIYVFLEGQLKIKLSDGIHQLIVSDGDMAGEDWVVV